MTYGKTVGHAVVNEKPDKPNGNNVFVITLDGFRWQELFKGADSSLLNDAADTEEAISTKELFWAKTESERRRKLMPFFWSTVVGEGQIFGNRRYKNYVNVSNIYALSYPGYNEMFTGTTDLTIFSNNKIRNRNVTLFEYLNNKPFFKGKVASFTSWEMFPYIFNQKRSKLHVSSHNRLSQKNMLSFFLNKKTKYNNDTALHHDLATYAAAKDYILKHHPRLVHIGLGGTDEYGHKRQYHNYLYQAHLADNVIAWLWQLVQSSSFYRDKTTFIITTDHGRGANKKDWHKHGIFVKGSSQTWMAFLGNGIRNMGECRNRVQLYQKQLAGTIGHFLNVTSYNNYSVPVSYFKPVEESVAAIQ